MGDEERSAVSVEMAGRPPSILSPAERCAVCSQPLGAIEGSPQQSSALQTTCLVVRSVVVIKKSWSRMLFFRSLNIIIEIVCCLAWFILREFLQQEVGSNDTKSDAKSACVIFTSY